MVSLIFQELLLVKLQLDQHKCLFLPMSLEDLSNFGQISLSLFRLSFLFDISLLLGSSHLLLLHEHGIVSMSQISHSLEKIIHNRLLPYHRTTALVMAVQILSQVNALVIKAIVELIAHFQFVFQLAPLEKDNV
jgi:hypothetical protein